MRRLGVDPGEWTTALAVVETEEPEVLALEIVPNEGLGERLPALVQLYGVEEAVVEQTTRGPWNPRVSRKALKRVRAVGNQAAEVLRRQGVRVYRPLASRPGAWYGGEEPGWRQKLTGLARPSEEDLFHLLLGLKRQGVLKGRIPRHKGLVDAIGMAMWR